jgi:hypothetical protein
MCKDNWLIRIIPVFLISVLAVIPAYSQALLPNISVYYKNGKNYITWQSGYTGIKQIGVQRSQDSLFNYATIGHVANPDKKENMFVDSHPQAGKNYYRLFILFTNNSYFFSNPTSQILAPVTLETSLPSNTPQAFTPSVFVYTNAEGNVNISLAQAPAKHYHIRFFDAGNHFLFDLNNIRQPFLILDKSNFMRSGWFHFELFEDGKLKEKWKFYIADSADK